MEKDDHVTVASFIAGAEWMAKQCERHLTGFVNRDGDPPPWRWKLDEAWARNILKEMKK
jgi:hypothetical protein